MSAPFSNRSRIDATPNRITLALEEHRSAGRPILDLTESNPTRAGLVYDHDGIARALAAAAALPYAPEPFGLASAREAVAQEHASLGQPTEPARVVLVASTSEAYAALFALLCDPGDEVLVPSPGYPLLEALAASASIELVPYRLHYDGEWAIDLDDLARSRTSRTRAIVVVNPNNPTGHFVKQHELATLDRLGVPIIADEVFAAYAHAGADASRVTLLGAASSSLVFSLGGLSKLAGLPQMKVSWMVLSGPGALVSAALARLEHLLDSTLSVNGPVQAALPELFRLTRPTREAIRSRISHNLQALRAQLTSDDPFSLLAIEGGWYATLRVPSTRSDEDWAVHLLRCDDTYIHPGFFFDFSRGCFLVLSLLTSLEPFDVGTRRITARIRDESKLEADARR